jgi:hypothetical protein
MPSDGFDRGDGQSASSEKRTHRVEFVTGADLARVDADPVLERTDLWVSEE